MHKVFFHFYHSNASFSFHMRREVLPSNKSALWTAFRYNKSFQYSQTVPTAVLMPRVTRTVSMTDSLISRISSGISDSSKASSTVEHFSL